jgi:Xaa-Pro dipeptidase
VPGGAGAHAIAPGEPVILDVAPGVDGYLVDQTRTLCIGGLPAPLARAYADMVAVQEHMVELARPGASCGRIYEACRALAERLGHAADFMGAAGSQVPFIGHGVGIELDELPLLARGFDASLLEEGMVFAFEPKAVYPGIGAVGVENTWVVVADGVRRLTLPSDELIVV